MTSVGLMIATEQTGYEYVPLERCTDLWLRGNSEILAKFQDIHTELVAAQMFAKVKLLRYEETYDMELLVNDYDNLMVPKNRFQAVTEFEGAAEPVAISAIATLKVWINASKLDRYVSDMQIEAAAAGLSISRHTVTINGDERVEGYTLSYGEPPAPKNVPHEKEILVVEASDPIGILKINNAIEYYRSRDALYGLAECCHEVLTLSSDGRMFEVPWQYRAEFVERQLGYHHSESQEKINFLAKQFDFVPITRKNVATMKAILNHEPTEDSTLSSTDD